MIVYLEPAGGSARASLERAGVEMERVLGFRGRVTGAEVEGNRIVVTIEVNPKWDLPEKERTRYLKEWIPVKVKSVFEVISVSD